MIIASHHKADIEGTDKKTPEGELDHDSKARQVPNLFKFKNSYDHIDFNPEQ